MRRSETVPSSSEPSSARSLEQEGHLARFPRDRFGNGLAEPIETLLLRREDDEIGAMLLDRSRGPRLWGPIRSQ